MTAETRHILVRYGEIGTKSMPVQRTMLDTLRQRVADKLKYEGIEVEKTSQRKSRIIIETDNSDQVLEALKLIPGIVSISPAVKVDSDIEEMKEAAEKFEYGETFGVDATTAYSDFSSMDLNREVGAHVEDFTGSSVDLDNPETWLGIEVKKEETFLFTETVDGPGGLPVGTQDEYLSLVSGGIDSPVATYQMMKSGADITPIYFYNRPIAAEDHLLRFKAVMEKLRGFHPEKKWVYYQIDMKEVNEALMEVGKGRMVLHRKIMFKVAEEIAEKEGLRGLVTGESLGQKSSQTAKNMENTTSEIEKPLMRPLLTDSKNDITEKAREIGTFELSEINSACQTLAPDSPSTQLKEEELEKLEEKVDIDNLVEKALDSAEKKEL